MGNTDTLITEVGSVEAHPIRFAWKQVKGVMKTWMYARKHGLPTNKWWGVYEFGTEIVLAQTGCLPGAKIRAHRICEELNRKDRLTGKG